MTFNSKKKGSAFERLTGRMVSMWITDGDRGDLFSRNVLSGGIFTRNVRKGEEVELGTPGDLVATNPLALEFQKRVNIECKHKKSLDLEALLFDLRGKSFLPRTLDTLRPQSHKLGCAPWVVAKQNMRPTVLLTDLDVGQIIAECQHSARLRPRMHQLQAGRMLALFQFEQVLATVSYEKLISRLAAWKPPGG